jgi:glycosyltransferase involved in cell wall biosynthesis
MDLDISLVSLWYPPYTWGGVGTQTFDVAHALARIGVNVTVYCGGSSTKEDMDKENLSGSLEVVRLPTVEIPPRFLWFQLKNRRTLAEKLKTCDIVHSQATGFSLCPLFLRGENKPWIVSFHGSPSGDMKVLLTTSPKRWNAEDVTTHILAFPVWAGFNFVELKYADNYIICGRAAAQDVIDFFHCDESKVHVIQNGIDFQKIETITNDLTMPIENGCPTLFYCGRLYWRKGIEYLIKAMPQIIEEHKNVMLKIFGRGPLKSEILRLISTLHLEKNVMLMGYASYPRLIKELNAADVAVFPSLYEGLSVAMLEAMACSKPVVTFDYPFTREIIANEKNGILVPPRSISKLSKAISYLLSNMQTTKKIGDLARSYVKKNHDWSLLSREYVKVYQKTLDNFLKST